MGSRKTCILGFEAWPFQKLFDGEYTEWKRETMPIGKENVC